MTNGAASATSTKPDVAVARFARWGMSASVLACALACASAREQREEPETSSASADTTQTTETTDTASTANTASAATVSASAAPAALEKRDLSPKQLPIEGFGTAAVLLPRGTAPAPLLVATHGAGGNPEWECERWGRVAKGRFFLLCPRGTPFGKSAPGAYFYADHLKLESEVMAGVKAARTAYPSRLATTGGVYVGYSQGATMGGLMLVDHGNEFPHLLLIEGGSSNWTLGRAKRFSATGGKSVFIVCGTPACGRRATTAKPVLESAGLRAEVRVVAGGGHTELGPVGDAAEKLLETLTTRD